MICVPTIVLIYIFIACAPSILFLFLSFTQTMFISTRSLFLFTILFAVYIQTVLADIYSQLQFIKIVSPKNGQDIKAGKPLVVKYVMQPLIKSKDKDNQVTK